MNKPVVNRQPYFAPKVIYSKPGVERKNSVIRYIGNRVLQTNKNFLAALVGSPGSGKSWAGLSICETYAEQNNIEFNPEIHVISSLKELLQLITAPDIEKKIRIGTAILFDEPQTEANSRSWQSEVNQAFNSLMSTFRNQRLVVFFALPYLSMIDKQSRILFHGEFKVDNFDKKTKMTRIRPMFLEWNENKGDFYRKRLIVEYAVPDKQMRNHTSVRVWNINKPSDKVIEVYESKKKKFTDELNKKLLEKIELKEKMVEGRNKSEDLLKVKALYEQYGENYLKILEEMPHLSPYVIQKHIWFIKKSLGKCYSKTRNPNAG